MKAQGQVVKCNAKPFGYECGEPATHKIELIFSKGKLVKYSCPKHLDHVTDETVMWMLSLLGMKERRITEVKEG